MKLECELAGAKAALQTLSSSEITLRKACEQHQSLVQELYEKQKRIEEYASRTVRILVMLVFPCSSNEDIVVIFS